MVHVCMHSMYFHLLSMYAYKRIKSRILAVKRSPEAVIRTIFVVLQS